MYEFFQSILVGINSFVGQWGWSVILFTLLIRIIIVPFDYKSRVSMRKTQKVQPELNRLQKKYANDKDKLNQKMSELYKKEGINPLSSCLPMLLTMPILFCMFGAMRLVANEQILIQVRTMLEGGDVHAVMQNWLWVKNIMMPDSPFASVLPSLQMLQQVTDTATWNKIFTPEVLANLAVTLPDLNLTAESFINNNAIQATARSIYDYLVTTPYYVASGPMPGWTFNLLITNITIMKDWNGLFILPVLSAASQFLMTKLTPAAPVERDAQGNKIQNPANPNTSGFMTWFFPLFSLWICSSYNGMFALYWVASNLIAMVETFGINKYLDMKDKKQQQAVEEVNGFVK